MGKDNGNLGLVCEKKLTPTCQKISDIIVKFKRGPYMNAHVLLNLLNEFGIKDKMRGLPSILFLLRKGFNKINIKNEHAS